MTSPADRRRALEILDGTVAAGASAERVADRMGIALRTLQRWKRQLAGDGDSVDRRKGSSRMVSHRLTDEERSQILRTCNQPQYAALPPGQIVPDLADQGAYLASESSFYRLLQAHGPAHRRGRAMSPQEPREVPGLKAEGPNEVWSWEITNLPTSVRGVWLYLYLVIDVWSRKVVAWDVAEREDPKTAADLVSRACLRERISKRRPHPLSLHADNGHAMRASALEIRLEELGELRSFSRPRVSNDNPFSESLFRTVKYQPHYPRRPFQTVKDACGWVAEFVEWYNHQHRHSEIRFVSPDQRYSGEAQAICRQRQQVYEQARQRHPGRWSRSIRCWRQPEVVWINPPPPEKRNPSGYLGKSRLMGGKGVIFPGSYRIRVVLFLSRLIQHDG